MSLEAPNTRIFPLFFSALSPSLLNKISTRSYKAPSSHNGSSSSIPQVPNAQSISEGTVNDLLTNYTLSELNTHQNENIEARDQVRSDLEDARLNGIDNQSIEELQRELNEWNGYIRDTDRAIELSSSSDSSASSVNEDVSETAPSKNEDQKPPKDDDNQSPKGGSDGGEGSSGCGGSDGCEGSSGGGGSDGGSSGSEEGSSNPSLKDIVLGGLLGGGEVLGQLGEILGNLPPFFSSLDNNICLSFHQPFLPLLYAFILLVPCLLFSFDGFVSDFSLLVFLY